MRTELIPLFIVAATVLAVAHAVLCPGPPRTTGAWITELARQRRGRLAFAALWAGWLGLLAFYVVVPWLRSL